MPTCTHGTFGYRGDDMSAGESGTKNRHEAKHRETGCTAQVFGHKGQWLGYFGVLCCTVHGELASWL